MLDIASSCRTCMKDNVTLVDLYETVKIDENSLQLAELLIQCTAVQLSQEDELPHKLCNDCARILQESYIFRYRAAKSEEEFKKILQNQVKTEPTEFKFKVEDDHNLFEGYEDFNYGGFKPEGDGKQYECTKCDKQYKNEKKYLKHLETHDKPVLKCNFCSKLYPNQSSLDKHVAKRHKDYECTICKSTFDTEICLLEHNMVVHTNTLVKTENDCVEQKYQCPKCDLSFIKQRSLAMHMKKHKDKAKNQVFICDICGKVFTNKSPLKRHLLIHSPTKPYKCTKCPKRYARHDQYTNHIFTHKDDKPYVCSYCKKGFGQLCSLKDHTRIHTGETPYLCSECGKGFVNSSNLRQHMMRHTGLKPYACNLCPKTFCTKGQLKSHISTHTGAHPYKCESCGAAFTKPNSLKKHAMIHLGVRPFACDSCNMRFTCKDHLKRHYRIHTGEKPYKCKFCERAFAQSNDLVKHTRGHIGDNIYQCTICGTRFRLLSELKLHYPVHFGKGNEATDSKEHLDTALTIDNTPTSIRDIKLPSNTDEYLKPKELSLASFKTPMSERDFQFLTSKPIEKVSKPHIDKDLSLLSLKPISEEFIGLPEIKGQENDNRITITINGCDKNGVVSDITINIASEGN